MELADMMVAGVAALGLDSRRHHDMMVLVQPQSSDPSVDPWPDRTAERHEWDVRGPQLTEEPRRRRQRREHRDVPHPVRISDRQRARPVRPTTTLNIMQQFQPSSSAGFQPSQDQFQPSQTQFHGECSYGFQPSQTQTQFQPTQTQFQPSQHQSQPSQTQFQPSGFQPPLDSFHTPLQHVMMGGGYTSSPRAASTRPSSPYRWRDTIDGDDHFLDHMWHPQSQIDAPDEHPQSQIDGLFGTQDQDDDDQSQHDQGRPVWDRHAPLCGTGGHLVDPLGGGRRGGGR
ncbi:unnamed protein product [Linum trigynum]|uniref:Uncharacterized protein n=1 Tax=Linum trigynum TaxID=586398 RepID=A0AAV2GAZ1_9ROSI